MNNISIFVADRYLHQDLRLQYLKETQSMSFGHIAFLTFSNFLELYSDIRINPLIQQMTLYQNLCDFPSPIFSTVLQTPSFIAELQDVRNSLLDNGIDLHDFPSDLASHQELKAILLAMDSDGPYQSSVDLSCMKHILTLDDLSHVCFVNFTPANQNQQWFYEEAKKLGLQSISYHTKAISIDYRYALNIRQEVEACAQEICQQLHRGMAIEDIQIVVSDIDVYTPIFDVVFPRYNLPYAIERNQKTPIAMLFDALLAHHRSPSVITFLDFIAHPVFQIPNLLSLRRYANHCSLRYEALFAPFDAAAKLNHSVNARTKQGLLHYEADATLAQEAYLPLVPLLQSKWLSELLLGMYDYLCDHQEKLDPVDIVYLHNLRYQFTPLLTQLDALPRDISCNYASIALAQVQVKEERKTPSILIGDIHHPYLPVACGYALGFHQKTYPNFKPLLGILDEQVAEQLASFEPLAIRYHRHIERCKQNLCFADNLVLSYPQGNFEGKVYESSLDLEMQFGVKHAKAWQLLENEAIWNVDHVLQPELAEQLFFTDNTLVGSISRFEKYFSCPYAYFLAYGLQLQEPLRFELMDAEVGELYHTFLHQVIQAYGKQYTQVDDEYIATFLEEHLEPYFQTFEKEAALYALIKDQLFYTIKQALMQLQQMEHHTSFVPTATERRFRHDITTYNDITVQLNGIIDRVDEVAHGFRIIDYKSSNRTFSLKDFTAGLSLQLVSYAYMVKQESGKEPFGSYYFSLKEPQQVHISYVINRRSKSIVYQDEATFLDEHRSQTKLTGINFIEKESDIVLLDESQSMVKGLTRSAKGVIKAKSEDFDTIAEGLLELYQILVERLQEGRIELEPVEGACSFCKFRVICHYHGTPKKPTAIISLGNKVEEEEA